MSKAGVLIKLTKNERNLLFKNTKPHMQYRFVQRAKIIFEAYKNQFEIVFREYN